MARKISSTFFITLDGVVQDPHLWSFPFWNDEIAKFKDQELKETDALFLGRKTYEGFAAVWPSRKDDEGFSDKFNSMPKYVVTSSLKKVDWSGSQIVRPAEIGMKVAQLKKENGGAVMAHGSTVLVRSLIKEDLLDELRLLVYPVVRGQGQRLFDVDFDKNFKLRSSKTFATGVVALIYEKAPKITEAEKKEATKKAFSGYKKNEGGNGKKGPGLKERLETKKR